MISSFWRRWLIAVCAIIVGFGAVLMGAAAPALQGPTLALMTLMHGAAPTLDAPLRFSIGLMGAVSFGWGLTLLAIVRAGTASPDLGRALWRPVTASLLLWFVIDSAISIATGFALNAASNTLLMAGWLAPMLASGLLRRPS